MVPTFFPLFFGMSDKSICFHSEDELFFLVILAKLHIIFSPKPTICQDIVKLDLI